MLVSCAHSSFKAHKTTKHLSRRPEYNFLDEFNMGRRMKLRMVKAELSDVTVPCDGAGLIQKGTQGCQLITRR